MTRDPQDVIIDRWDCQTGAWYVMARVRLAGGAAGLKAYLQDVQAPRGFYRAFNRLFRFSAGKELTEVGEKRA